jgi:hypothetical protein
MPSCEDTHAGSQDPGRHGGHSHTDGHADADGGTHCNTDLDHNADDRAAFANLYADFNLDTRATHADACAADSNLHAFHSAANANADPDAFTSTPANR